LGYHTLSNTALLSEKALREEFVRIGRLMHRRNYVTATDGNISARLGDDRFLVTPSGQSKGFMQPEEMIVIDWDARPVDGDSGRRPSSEILLHLEAYRQRPDIHAVVHAHPPTAIALSIAGISLARCQLPEVIVTLGLIVTTDYATPASAEGAAVIRDLIRVYDALILKRHGSVTVGSSPWDAYLKLEKVENAAEIAFRLRLLGREETLPCDALAKLLDNREKMGLMRPGEREVLEQACGCPDES
jgi:L-fuculose-phosphate aldolase